MRNRIVGCRHCDLIVLLHPNRACALRHFGDSLPFFSIDDEISTISAVFGIGRAHQLVVNVHADVLTAIMHVFLCQRASEVRFWMDVLTTT